MTDPQMVKLADVYTRTSRNGNSRAGQLIDPPGQPGYRRPVQARQRATAAAFRYRLMSDQMTAPATCAISSHEFMRARRRGRPEICCSPGYYAEHRRQQARRHRTRAGGDGMLRGLRGAVV